MKKIIQFNIIVIVCILFLIEITLFSLDYRRIRSNVNENNHYSLKSHIYNYSTNFARKNFIRNYDFREQAENKYNDSPSIILLGCSYTYGYKLSNEDSFHYILSEALKSPVYNLAIVGGSPREMLYLLRNKPILNEQLKNVDKNNIKYIIFTYMSDHKKRIIADLYRRSPNFIITKDGNGLQFKRPNPLDNFYISRKIKEYIANKQYQSDDNFKLLCLYIEEIKKESAEIFKYQGHPAEFILLLYDDYNNNWDILQQDNIKIIKLNEILDVNITDREYQISEKDCHPNKKAWEIIVPQLIKELD